MFAKNFDFAFSTTKASSTCNVHWCIVPQFRHISTKLILAAEVLASLFQSLVVPGLTILSEFSLFGWNTFICIGYVLTSVDFQASVSLISADNWLTDWRLYFVSKDAFLLFFLVSKDAVLLVFLLHFPFLNRNAQVHLCGAKLPFQDMCWL